MADPPVHFSETTEYAEAKKRAIAFLEAEEGGESSFSLYLKSSVDFDIQVGSRLAETRGLSEDPLWLQFLRNVRFEVYNNKDVQLRAGYDQFVAVKCFNRQDHITEKFEVPAESFRSNALRMSNERLLTRQLFCAICGSHDLDDDNILETVEDIINHFLTYHGQLDLFACHFCLRSYTTKEELIAHNCVDYQTYSHEQSLVSGYKHDMKYAICLLICADCGRRFRLGTTLGGFALVQQQNAIVEFFKIHSPTHIVLGFVHSEEILNQTAELKICMTSALVTDLRYDCSSCGIPSFSSAEQRNKHFSRSHGVENMENCPNEDCIEVHDHAIEMKKHVLENHVFNGLIAFFMNNYAAMKVRNVGLMKPKGVLRRRKRVKETEEEKEREISELEKNFVIGGIPPWDEDDYIPIETAPRTNSTLSNSVKFDENMLRRLGREDLIPKFDFQNQDKNLRMSTKIFNADGTTEDLNDFEGMEIMEAGPMADDCYVADEIVEACSIEVPFNIDLSPAENLKEIRNVIKYCKKCRILMNGEKEIESHLRECKLKKGEELFDLFYNEYSRYPNRMLGCPFCSDWLCSIDGWVFHMYDKHGILVKYMEDENEPIAPVKILKERSAQVDLMIENFGHDSQYPFGVEQKNVVLIHNVENPANSNNLDTPSTSGTAPGAPEVPEAPEASPMEIGTVNEPVAGLVDDLIGRASPHTSGDPPEAANAPVAPESANVDVIKRLKNLSIPSEKERVEPQSEEIVDVVGKFEYQPDQPSTSGPVQPIFLDDSIEEVKFEELFDNLGNADESEEHANGNGGNHENPPRADSPDSVVILEEGSDEPERPRKRRSLTHRVREEVVKADDQAVPNCAVADDGKDEIAITEMIMTQKKIKTEKGLQKEAPVVEQIVIAEGDEECMAVAEVVTQDHGFKTKSKRAATNKCPKCSNTYLTKQSLESHLFTDHRADFNDMYEEDYGLPIEGEFYVCVFCTTAFESHQKFLNHSEMHNRKNNVNILCPLCAGYTISEGEYIQHVQKHNEGMLRWVCTDCRPGQRLKTEGELLFHQKDFHGVQMVWFCKNCFKGKCKPDDAFAHHIRTCNREIDKSPIQEKLGIVSATTLSYQPEDEQKYLEFAAANPALIAPLSVCSSRSLIRGHMGAYSCFEMRNDGQKMCHVLNMCTFAFEYGANVINIPYFFNERRGEHYVEGHGHCLYSKFIEKNMNGIATLEQLNSRQAPEVPQRKRKTVQPERMVVQAPVPMPQQQMPHEMARVVQQPQQYQQVQQQMQQQFAHPNFIGMPMRPPGPHGPHYQHPGPQPYMFPQYFQQPMHPGLQQHPGPHQSPRQHMFPPHVLAHGIQQPEPQQHRHVQQSPQQRSVPQSPQQHRHVQQSPQQRSVPQSPQQQRHVLPSPQQRSVPQSPQQHMFPRFIPPHGYPGPQQLHQQPAVQSPQDQPGPSHAPRQHRPSPMQQQEFPPSPQQRAQIHMYESIMIPQVPSETDRLPVPQRRVDDLMDKKENRLLCKCLAYDPSSACLICGQTNPRLLNELPRNRIPSMGQMILIEYDRQFYGIPLTERLSVEELRRIINFRLLNASQLAYADVVPDESFSICGSHFSNESRGSPMRPENARFTRMTSTFTPENLGALSELYKKLQNTPALQKRALLIQESQKQYMDTMRIKKNVKEVNDELQRRALALQSTPAVVQPPSPKRKRIEVEEYEMCVICKALRQQSTYRKDTLMQIGIAPSESWIRRLLQQLNQLPQNDRVLDYDIAREVVRGKYMCVRHFNPYCYHISNEGIQMISTIRNEPFLNMYSMAAILVPRFGQKFENLLRCLDDANVSFDEIRKAHEELKKVTMCAHKSCKKMVQTSLLTYLHSMHDEGYAITCGSCYETVRIESRSDLERIVVQHLIDDHGVLEENRIRCFLKCQKHQNLNFENLFDYQAHLAENHRGDEDLRMSICGNLMENDMKRVLHDNEHKMARHMQCCLICRKVCHDTFKIGQKQYRHDMIHTARFRFICTICGIVSNDQEELALTHFERNHKSGEECGICRVKATSDHYYKHIHTVFSPHSTNGPNGPQLWVRNSYSDDVDVFI